MLPNHRVTQVKVRLQRKANHKEAQLLLVRVEGCKKTSDLIASVKGIILSEVSVLLRMSM